MLTLHDHISHNVSILLEIRGMLDEMFVLGNDAATVSYMKGIAIGLAAKYEQKLNEFEDAIELLSCPGHTILETLQEKNIPMELFQEQVGGNKLKVEHLLDGRKRIDEDIAERLQQFFGIDAKFWIDREKLYREELAKL